MSAPDVVVVGGGLAGTSLAWHLGRSGAARVLLLEREPALGTHASSQNAAMIRRLVEDPVLAELAREGGDFVADPPDDLREELGGVAPFTRTGSLLVAATADGAEELRAMVDDARAAGVDAELWAPAACARRAPGLSETAISAGAYCASDGIADPAALVDAFARAARRRGVRIETGARVTGARVRDGRVVAVETDRTSHPCAVAVNAGGAWAAELGSRLGSAGLDLVPYRRHLAVSGPMAGFDGWPLVWDVERGFYARPESGRLLYCACDEGAAPAGVPEVDGEVYGAMAEKAAVLLPGVELGVARTWAGLRTFAPDRRFVIGPDPGVEGLHWLAALGGHGVTVAGSVGRLAAEQILGTRRGPPSLDPARLALCHW